MRKLPAVILVVVLAIMHVIVLGKATDAARALVKTERTAFVVPSPILKIAALEFDGLAADFMFLKALVFMGSTFERKDLPRIKEAEWRWLGNVLEASAGLDPYFFDPYYFANANLTWDGGLIREANILLEKGSRFRDWDWRLPFYLGFNNFYFLHENTQASKFLMEAARRPGGSPMLASLASKMAYKERRTETAILFLEEIIEKTDQEDLKIEYGTRLEALRGIDVLEKAVGAYQKQFKRAPRKLEELLDKKLIAEIPPDPYGGNYYIDADGVVKTTSEEHLMPFIRKK
ncbi:MAG TPA: hypothetical protein VN604_00655 [Nitrospirota bacterium]|nr:hypothetical protein [Nitrospirota bacterium]